MEALAKERRGLPIHVAQRDPPLLPVGGGSPVQEQLRVHGRLARAVQQLQEISIVHCRDHRRASLVRLAQGNLGRTQHEGLPRGLQEGGATVALHGDPAHRAVAEGAGVDSRGHGPGRSLDALLPRAFQDLEQFSGLKNSEALGLLQLWLQSHGDAFAHHDELVHHLHELCSSQASVCRQLCSKRRDGLVNVNFEPWQCLQQGPQLALL
mmetsp:Transcript_20094/g.60566  ORF Transcript_20094/g.60566 Transcript_20094/m.60566 type:complete len:209 (+) Transcript_20094:602-1228(+)